MVNSREARVEAAAYLARVIDEAGRIPVNRGVYHSLFVNSKHVAAHSFGLVLLFSFVTQHGPDDLARVLDNHFAALENATNRLAA